MNFLCRVGIGDAITDGAQITLINRYLLNCKHTAPTQNTLKNVIFTLKMID